LTNDSESLVGSSGGEPLFKHLFREEISAEGIEKEIKALLLHYHRHQHRNGLTIEEAQEKTRELFKRINDWLSQPE